MAEEKNELTINVTKNDEGEVGTIDIVHKCDENTSLDFNINSKNEISATVKVKFWLHIIMIR